MLTELHISHLGVIDEATVDLGPGLTVVSGETGAGKTLIVIGLALVTGGRADGTLVRHDTATALVEARFDQLPAELIEQVVAAGGALDGAVDGLPAQTAPGAELLVARQVTAAGRSRSWLGGVAVPVSLVRDLDLVTIHGQSEQVRLSTPERQRQVLDRAAGPELDQVLRRYRRGFDQRKAVAADLAELTTASRDRAREADMLGFGLTEIRRVAPQPGEDEALRDEARRLQAADGLRQRALAAVVALTGDDTADDQASVLSSLAQARQALRQAAHDDGTAAVLAGLAEDVWALAADLAGQTAGYLAGLAADPVRLDWIEQRLAELKSLTRKYGADTSEVLAWAAVAEQRLSEIDGADERIDQLNARLVQLDAELGELAGQISASRRRAADQFAQAVAVELAALAMPSARVEFTLTPLAELGPWGADAIALLFTANPGLPAAPLAKVASGGELSRVRLAIEVVLAEPESATCFVFDEVDAGIGGVVGLAVGQRLARLAQSGQVIVVTHLAQVAAFADRQLVVVKTEDEVTASGVTEVTGQARLVELARMMGGLGETANSLAHAQELLDEAAQWRARHP